MKFSTRPFICMLLLACLLQVSTYAQNEVINPTRRIPWWTVGNANTTNPAVPGVYGTTLIGALEHFAGTLDGQDFVLGTNQTERIRIKQTTGFTGIGTAIPSERLHVTGNFRLDNAFMPANTAGTTGQVLRSQGAGVAPIWADAPFSSDSFCAAAAAGYVPVFTSTSVACNSVLYQNGTNVGLNTTTASVSVELNTTDGIRIPTGTTAQRPGTPPQGTLRYNTTLGTTEIYTGSCWQNVNTPAIGSTYVQWVNAADPNTLYPCTQWVSTDMQSGQFIRAEGGNSNVAANTALTGTIQADAVKDHTHSATGSAAGAGILTSSASGNHNHNWGGHWSNDDSREYTNDNGDGNGNTISDWNFWWGGSPATGNFDSRFFRMTSSPVNPFNSSIYIPYDDNVNSNVRNLSMNDNPTPCGTGWDGRNTVGNFMGRLNDNCMNHTHTVDMYAHRHWIKTRATTTVAAHSHTIPDHSHAITVTVNGMSSGSATETRPSNVVLRFWRRTL